jgi:hypothetical protein
LNLQVFHLDFQRCNGSLNRLLHRLLCLRPHLIFECVPVGSAQT